MQEQLLFEMTMNHVRSTVAMIDGEQLDSVPLALSVVVERAVDAEGFVGENRMFGIEMADEDNPHLGYIWAELLTESESVELVFHRAKEHDDVGAEVAKIMLVHQETVLAIFVLATGLVEVHEATLSGMIVETMHSAVIAGQDCDGRTCIAHLPVKRLDGKLTVVGDVRVSMARGHFSIFDRFWDVFRGKEKSFAAFN